MRTRFHEWMKSAERMGEYRVTVVERRMEAEAEYTAMYLETELIPGQRVKTYLWLGVPHGAKPLPAILHIHGGGMQTADLNHVKHWAGRGYVAVSYDWKERHSGQERYSDLADMPRADMEDEHDPLKSVMFTRVIHAKKMVTWLAALPEVDPDRIGAYGISRGGSVIWLLNAWDSRLKAAAPLYGCGKHMAPGRLNRNSRKAHTLEDTLEWERLLDGVKLAGQQHAPMLIMAATNDFWGWMDAVCEGAAQIPKEKRGLFFATNQNHHLDQWAGPTLDKWMDAHLKQNSHWPQTPVAEVAECDGKLKVFARLDPSLPMPEKLRFCWSWYDWSEVLPPGRYWHVKEIDRSAGNSVEIPVTDAQISGYVYVDAVYADGVKTSSFPLRFSPGYIGAVPSGAPASLELADFSAGLDGWHCPEMRTEPFDPEFRYAFLDDPLGGKALTLCEPGLPFALVTHKPVDPMMERDKDHKRLQLRLYADCTGAWKVSLFYRPDQAGQKIWVCEFNADTGWMEARLERNSFRNAEGQSLPTWEKAHKIAVSFVPADDASSGSPALGSVRFV
jgi:dienelactone hydrolase